MQRNDLVEKVRILIDGQEFNTLVKFQELSIEEGEVEVPEFRRTRILKNGVDKIPALDLTFKVQRNSPEYTFLKNWKFKNETHDITKIRTDAHGIEFSRTILTQCDCSKYTEPEYSAESPTYAQMSVRIIPWDIIVLT